MDSVNKPKDTGSRAELVWFNIILFVLFHAIPIIYVPSILLQVKWQTWVWGCFIAGVAGFGVTGGAHRMWSHRAFKGTLLMRIIMAFCYSFAGQNTILEWVRDHRVHHKFTETDADPHNAQRGFFFAHMGWLMQKKHPDVIKQGKKIDLSDIENDPVVKFHTKYFTPLKMIFCFIIPALVPYYCWNETLRISILSCIVRYILGSHIVWSVNSAAHLYGNRPFDKRINPAENWVVSFLGMGEGWHNYHHVFPWDYKASEHFFLNLTGVYLEMFSALGLVYDKKVATPNMIQRVVQKYGDGSHFETASTNKDLKEISYEEYLNVLKENEKNTGIMESNENK